MANKIHNAGMTLEEILSEEEPAEVTTLYGGDPTVEEAEKAFDELFKESQQAFDKFMNIRR
jgi:hypothetical protein